MRRALLSSAGAISVILYGAAPAIAQDNGDLFDISGPYIGGHLGYGEADYSGVIRIGSSDPDLVDPLNPGGFVGGIHLGYNHLFPHQGEFIDAVLLGIEGDVSFMDWEDSVSGVSSIALTEAEVNLLASVRARLGIVVGQTLLYATAGIAFKNAEFAATEDPVSSARGSTNLNDVGGVVGGGLEVALFGQDTFLVRVEGLYYIFDDRRDTSGLVAVSRAGDFTKFEDAFVVRAGVTIPLNNLFQGFN